MTSFLRKVALSVGAWIVPCSGPASAVVVKIASTGGLLQQPTSHYYHAIYGGLVDVARDDDWVIGRVQYLERPEFNVSGFADKDYGAFAMIGTKLTKAKSHGLYAFFGAGRMLGYVRASNDDTRLQAAAISRDYSLPGPTATVAYAWRWRSLELAANHQTFIGYVDEAQTEAYVAWPFNIFQATIGVAW